LQQEIFGKSSPLNKQWFLLRVAQIPRAHTQIAVLYKDITALLNNSPTFNELGTERLLSLDLFPDRNAFPGQKDGDFSIVLPFISPVMQFLFSTIPIDALHSGSFARVAFILFTVIRISAIRSSRRSLHRYLRQRIYLSSLLRRASIVLHLIL
jgi:hypothetical protein